MKKFFFTLAILSIISTSHAQTTIVVDWSIDEDSSSNTHTCTYTQGGLFQPDTTGTGAGKCTFRRALREAGARADNSICPGCAPITIVFTGLNGTNGDADDINFSASDNQWVLPLDDAGGSTPCKYCLKPQTGIDSSGNITIQGPAVDVLAGQMPKIIIESDRTLQISLDNVTIKNMGFMGGQSIHWQQANGTFMNNTWGLSPDGMSIVFDDLAGNPDNLAGNHAILTTTNQVSNMLIQGNVIAGASTEAIELGSNSTGNRILNNRIGMRIDGSVPVVPEAFKCRTFTSILPVVPPIDSSEWFGGEGISAAGIGLLIEGNTLAGLQTIHSTNTTPAGAIRILGRLHTVQMNTIGKDINGFEVGVCGQGIHLSTLKNTDNPQLNTGHMILDNELYGPRNGFDNTKGAILWSDSSVSSRLDGGNTVRRNLVVNGTEKYHEIGPLLSTSIRVFEPAQINTISGTLISGGNNQSNIDGSPSPCPNCIIDFYLDDGDINKEALEYLGTTTANANGDFSFTLAQPLPTGFGIRTTSTSVADGVIGASLSGQTSKMSSTVYGTVQDPIFSSGFE